MDQTFEFYKTLDLLMYSRELARLTTTEAAILYGGLLSIRQESIAAGDYVTIDEKIFFPALQEEIELETGLTSRRIRPAASKLVEVGVLEKKRIGLPAMNYYHIVPDRMFEFFDMKGGDL